MTLLLGLRAGQRKGRIRRTRARIAARKAAGQDARDDERWQAIELDFLRTLEDLLKDNRAPRHVSDVGQPDGSRIWCGCASDAHGSHSERVPLPLRPAPRA
jgi:hypothetical protein